MTTIETRASTIDWRTAAHVIAPAVLFGALVAHPTSRVLGQDVLGVGGRPVGEEADQVGMQGG